MSAFSRGFIASAPEPITIEDIEKSINFVLTSDQKRWLTSARDLATTRTKIVNDFFSSHNEILEKVFNSALDDIINVMLPLVPVDTGRLRAAFVNSFKIDITTNVIGEKVQESTIAFELERLLSEVPYAKFYISEITGIETVAPAGTKSLDLIVISDRLKQIPSEIAAGMRALGWDADVLETAQQELEDAFSAIFDITGGGNT